MRIGIDGSPLTIPFYCGQKGYLENLISSLAKVDRKNEYLIFAAKKVSLPKQKNFRLILLPRLPFFKRQLALPLVARQQNLDLFHYPDVWGSIFFKFPKTVVTSHDRAPASSFPKWSESLKYALMGKVNEVLRRITIQYSSVIIVSSTATARGYAQLAGFDKAVIPVHLGVSREFKKTEKTGGKNFFLAMTDFSPRKNIYRIMAAYSRFLRGQPRKAQLYIIVSTAEPKKAIFYHARKLGIQKQIKILQNVSPKRLVGLYNRSLCLLYPSLYEGFGLPILEAMACGCPVITSNFGAMKEVAGGAAYLVNPRSVTQIEKAMEVLSQDTAIRKSLTRKGLKRVKSFSWENTARKTLKVYEELFRGVIMTAYK